MKRFNNALATSAGVALLLTASSANAVTQVSTPAELLGPLVVEDFEDETFVPGVTFSASSGLARYRSIDASESVTTSGIWGLSTVDAPEPIFMDFDFAQPARSVGMFFGNDDACCSSGFTAYLDIYRSTGLLDTIGVVANMNDYVDQFLGFNSDAPVTSVTLRYGSGNDVALYHYIDDFQFSTVPEPGNLILAVLVASCALAYRRFVPMRCALFGAST